MWRRWETTSGHTELVKTEKTESDSGFLNSSPRFFKALWTSSLPGGSARDRNQIPVGSKSEQELKTQHPGSSLSKGNRVNKVRQGFYELHKWLIISFGTSLVAQTVKHLLTM